MKHRLALPTFFLSTLLLGSCTDINQPSDVAISGVVQDYDTGEPIADVRVMYEQDTVYTGTDGTFALPHYRTSTHVYFERVLYTSREVMDVLEAGSLGTVTMKAHGTEVARYTMDGTTSDNSGHNHYGTGIGVTPTADRFGNAGGAMAFSGQNSSISVSNSADFDFDRTGFTVTAWVKVDPSVTTGSIPIVSHATGTIYYSMTGIRASLYMDGSGGYYPELSYNNDIDYHDYIAHDVHGRSGSWHFVAFRMLADWGSWTGVNLRVDTLDGDAWITGAASGSFAASAPLVIGGKAGSTAFQGALDDVRIFRGMLTPSDLNMLRKDPTIP
jgi:hypothetical protein